MKKLLALTLTLLMVLSLAGCSSSTQSLYEQAQIYLGTQEYLDAASMFEQLGEYSDAADYALYARALDALESGDQLLARNTFTSLGNFKSAPRYLAYLDAEQLAFAGEIDEALMAFEKLGVFYHSADRADDMRVLRRQATLHQAELQLKAGNIEAAQELIGPYAATDEGKALMNSCDTALKHAAYDAAQALYAAGSYLEAYDAFIALDDTLDAASRAQLCRAALYRQAEEAYPDVTLIDCDRLMAIYNKLSGYLNADDRFDALFDAYGARLALLEEAAEHPYVICGKAETAASDAATPVVWRVLTADQETATLVCCAVLTSRAAATASDLTMDLTVPETPAEPVLSTAADWTMDAEAVQSMLEDSSALQTILTGSDSLCARWMATLQQADQATLCGCIPADDGLGLRPVISVPMGTWPLTGGLGTWADPYR